MVLRCKNSDFALRDWPAVQSPSFHFTLIRRNRCCTVVLYLQSPDLPLIIAVSSR